MKTTKFTATLGVNAGYGHANENESAAETVAREWQKVAAEELASSGTYVGAVIEDSKTVYHTDWGCPVGGEATASISGTCNPEYTPIEAYKDAVLRVLEACARALGQKTTQVDFAEVDIAHLDFRKES